ncbi:hypothetical protein FB451DRAFT_1020375, partial [Mycena latifolia]
ALVSDMIQADPSLRPDMDEVARRFREIFRGLSSWKLRSRVVKAVDERIFAFYYAVPHWTRRIQFILRRIPPIRVS